MNLFLFMKEKSTALHVIFHDIKVLQPQCFNVHIIHILIESRNNIRTVRLYNEICS